MSAKALERLRDLLARALHEETPTEEARTCAMQICRLIQKHNLVVTTAYTAEDISSAFESARKKKYRRRVDEDVEHEGRWIRSRFDSICIRCAASIPVNTRCFWVKGQGVTCAGCM